MAGERVLVVEDNETNMKLVRDVLQAKGYSTLEATTGEDAVELALSHEPALVLMDVQLPGIDGVEALGRLRGDERTAFIPVLALTAQAMSGDRERFLEAGFNGYLSKPIDVVELIQLCRSTAGGCPWCVVGVRDRASDWHRTAECRRDISVSRVSKPEARARRRLPYPRRCHDHRLSSERGSLAGRRHQHCNHREVYLRMGDLRKHGLMRARMM